MNTGWTKHLIDTCRRTEAWRVLSLATHPSQEHRLTTDQVAFVVFAEHVELWIDELEKILHALRHPQADDYNPQCDWPAPAWVAHYDGRFSAIDIRKSGLLASISGFESAAIPRWQRFNQLFNEVADRIWELRARHGLSARTKVTVV